jgi:hypothetical protein
VKKSSPPRFFPMRVSELGGRVASRVEPAEKVGEHADVRQFLEGEPTQVEVVIDVVDSVRVELVGDAGQRGLGVARLGFGGGGLHVVHREARQAGQPLGRVRCLLLVAKRLDLARDGCQVLLAHLGPRLRELQGLVGGVSALHGHELHLGRVRALADEPLEQAFEVPGVEAGLELGEGILVAQVVQAVARRRRASPTSPAWRGPRRRGSRPSLPRAG